MRLEVLTEGEVGDGCEGNHSPGFSVVFMDHFVVCSLWEFGID